MFHGLLVFVIVSFCCRWLISPHLCLIFLCVYIYSPQLFLVLFSLIYVVCHDLFLLIILQQSPVSLVYLNILFLFDIPSHLRVCWLHLKITMYIDRLLEFVSKMCFGDFRISQVPVKEIYWYKNQSKYPWGNRFINNEKRTNKFSVINLQKSFYNDLVQSHQ